MQLSNVFSFASGFRGSMVFQSGPSGSLALRYMKNKILLISIFLMFAGIIYLLNVNNGKLRSWGRLLFDIDYPVEMEKITSNLIEFDLSKKKPAMLTLGIRYPKENELQGVDGWQINRDIEVKLYIDGTLDNELSISKFDKTWLDFQNSGYKVSIFYTFEWSPPFKIFGDIDNSKVTIDLKNKFQGYNLILTEGGIK